MSVASPSFDSGFVTLTGSLVDVPTTTVGTIYPAGLYIQNPTTDPIAVNVQDAAGNSLVPSDLIVAPGQILPIDMLTMPITGKPKWSGAGLVCKMWGWTSWPF